MTAGEDFETARITITRRLTADGADIVRLSVEPEEITLLETLGMLRMAEDSAIELAQGDVQ